MIDFLTDLKSIFLDELFYDISDDECFYFYGMLCGYQILTKKSKESIFNQLCIKQFPLFYKMLKKYFDINELTNIYTYKYNFFFNEKKKKNINNIFHRWFNLLYKKELDSIPWIIKNKNKKYKNQQNVGDIETEDSKNEISEISNSAQKEGEKNEINNSIEGDSEDKNENSSYGKSKMDTKEETGMDEISNEENQSNNKYDISSSEEVKSSPIGSKDRNISNITITINKPFEQDNKNDDKNTQLNIINYSMDALEKKYLHFLKMKNYFLIH